MGADDILAEIGETVATALVREVFARLDNEMDARGEIVTRGAQLLAAMAKSSDLPDRAGEALDAFARNRARLHAEALARAAAGAPQSVPDPHDIEDPDT